MLLLYIIMDTLLYASSLYSIGFIIYVLALIFAVKKMQKLMYLLSFLVAIIGILFCLINQYYITATVFSCGIIFWIILHVGLQESKTKAKACGSQWDNLLEKEAYTAQELTPRGTIIIDNETIPARSTGVYIPKNAKVRIIKVTKKVVVVEEVSNE